MASCVSKNCSDANWALPLSLKSSELYSILSIVILYLPKNILDKLPLPYRGNELYIYDMIKMFFLFIILNYGHNIAFFYAYNNIPLSIYGALENNNVIASLIIGYFILNEDITPKKIIGCIMIIIGILSGVYYENDKKLKKY